MTPEKRGVGTLQKYKSRVVLRGVEDSGAYAVFTEQGSSASQMTAAKIMDVIARLQTVKDKQQIRYQPAPKWSSMEDAAVPLERNLHGHPLAGLLWERQFEEIYENLDGKKVFVHKKRGLFLSVHVDDIKKWLDGKKQKMAPMWKKLMKNVDLDEFSSFLDHPLGMHWTWMQTKWNYFWRTHKNVWITYFCRSNGKIHLGGKNLTQKQLPNPMIWKDIPKKCVEK